MLILPAGYGNQQAWQSADPQQQQQWMSWWQVSRRSLMKVIGSENTKDIVSLTAAAAGLWRSSGWECQWRIRRKCRRRRWQ